jgi:hypothetical protein
MLAVGLPAADALAANVSTRRAPINAAHPGLGRRRRLAGVEVGSFVVWFIARGVDGEALADRVPMRSDLRSRRWI